MQTKRVCAAILAWVLFSAAAGADTVYMRDGKSYSGKVTVEGQKVLIDDGTNVVEVKLKEVVYISRKGATKPTGSKIKTKPSESAGRAWTKVYSINDVTSPEPILFMFMRKLEGESPGMDSYRIRKQIEQWQIAAHEQKRKVGGKWVGREYFPTRRHNYEELLKDCRTMVLSLRRMRTKSQRQKATQLAMKKKLGTKLTEAARSWPDPQIRLFLTGVAHLRSDDFARAESAFRACAEQTPLVAAYHQGHGMSLMGLKRSTNALEAFVRMLRLRPESSLAVHLVTDAVKKVPGMDIKKPIYKEATVMLSEYRQGSSYRKRSGTTWLMPDKRPWSDPDDTLPTPTYDRLAFRQAVGVPIGTKTLLVDKAVIKDAIEVMVQIDGGKVVPGKVRRISYYGRKDDPAPLAMVSIDGYELTSVVGEIDTKFRSSKEKPKPKFTAETDVTIHGLAYYVEMGGAVRKTSGHIKSVKDDGEIELAGSLLAGDAAGPVLTRGGELVGFLSSRIEASSAGGGKSEFIEMAQIEPLIVQARRSSRAYSSISGYDRAVRKITPRKLEGNTFVVYGVFGERF